MKNNSAHHIISGITLFDVVLRPFFLLSYWSTVWVHDTQEAPRLENVYRLNISGRLSTWAMRNIKLEYSTKLSYFYSHFQSYVHSQTILWQVVLVDFLNNQFSWNSDSFTESIRLENGLFSPKVCHFFRLQVGGLLGVRQLNGWIFLVNLMLLSL